LPLHCAPSCGRTQHHSRRRNRDFETAEIAVKAALTGHLVLFHAAHQRRSVTISRLMNMGIEPFLVATSVNLNLRATPGSKNMRELQGTLEVPEQTLLDAGFTQEENGVNKFYIGKDAAPQ